MRLRGYLAFSELSVVKNVFWFRLVRVRSI